MDFKDKIKSRRLELGLTLEDVAHKMGVSAPTIQRYESGEIQNMRRDKIQSLANALNLSPAYLMGWQKEKTEVNSCENHNPVLNQTPDDALSDDEKTLLNNFRLLNNEGQYKLLDYSDDLINSNKYEIDDLLMKSFKEAEKIINEIDNKNDDNKNSKIG